MALALSRSAFFAVDVPSAIAFYRAAFGLVPSVLDFGRTYAEFDFGGTMLCLVARDLCGTAGVLGRACRTPSGNDGADAISFVSDDLAADWSRALAAGATALAAPGEGRAATLGLLRDPCGVLIELAARAPAQSAEIRSLYRRRPAPTFDAHLAATGH
jgi:lactoylglutathione lyase